MNVYIKSPTISYCIKGFESLGRFNLIQGNSGTGKSFFCKMVAAYNTNKASKSVISYNGPLPLYYVSDQISAEDALLLLQNKTEPHLVVADENAPFIGYSFTYLNKALHTTSHKYLIVSRKIGSSDFIPFDSSNIYIIDYNPNNKTNYIKKRFTHYYTPDEPVQIDKAFIEDAKSGLAFFQSYFPNIESISVNSKNNLNPELSKYMESSDNSKHENVLAVLDLIAFGTDYAALESLVKMYKLFNKNLYTVVWKSFEEYILRSPNFDPNLTNSCVTEKDYTTTLKSVLPTEKYSKVTKNGSTINGYSKSSLGDCLSSTYSCKICPLFATCPIKVTTRKHSNYIHSDLKNILQPVLTDSSLQLQPTTSSQFQPTLEPQSEIQHF